jgi:hypothetical protein
VHARVEEILRSIPGVVDLAMLDPSLRRRIVETERNYEESSTLPVRNLGIAIAAGRDFCFAILKGASFRQPTVPTVYLVEDDAGEGGEHAIVVDGKTFRIVGEEIIGATGRHHETVIPIAESFVIFPERRSGAGVPCGFILPPLGFPELEACAGELGIADIVSISPSIAVDSVLRESFGFPCTNALATLLLGFNLHRGREG